MLLVTVLTVELGMREHRFTVSPENQYWKIFALLAAMGLLINKLVVVKQAINTFKQLYKKERQQHSLAFFQKCFI